MEINIDFDEASYEWMKKNHLLMDISNIHP
jgi:hypothetical protein